MLCSCISQKLEFQSYQSEFESGTPPHLRKSEQSHQPWANNPVFPGFFWNLLTQDWRHSGLPIVQFRGIWNVASDIFIHTVRVHRQQTKETNPINQEELANLSDVTVGKFIQQKKDAIISCSIISSYLHVHVYMCTTSTAILCSVFHSVCLPFSSLCVMVKQTHAEQRSGETGRVKLTLLLL